MNNTEITNKFFLPVAVILAGIFIAGAVIWSGSHPAKAPGTADDGAIGAPVVDSKSVKTEGNPFIGKADAPVTIAFWSDFQCPYCRAVEVGGIPQITIPAALPDIIKNYVDTGKVKVVFMDFTFLGNDSIAAALYSHSVWKLYPNKYFEWREAVFSSQDEEGDQGFGDPESIDKLDATISGLDAAKIAADVKANTAIYQAMIDSDMAEAGKMGVTATPSFVIGKQMLAGAYPYAKFQEVIDAALKQI
ncbi:MAG: thioredoxin domain-containing protein [Candidatus Paceibacterota bacterium]